jgi:hypothetical protein
VIHRLPAAFRELWFPRSGGWTNFNGRDALLALPGYQSHFAPTGPVISERSGH